MLEQLRKLDFYCHKDSFKVDENVKSDLIFGDFNSPAPTYSLLIPTLNRADLVEKALKSGLNQEGFKDYEIIILDINPDKNNETQQVLNKYKKYKNVFVYQAQGNLIGWNRVVQLVRTEWFAMLLDDDLLYPHYFKTMDAILKKHPEMDALAPKYEFFGGNINKNPLSAPSKEPFSKKLKRILRECKLIPPKKVDYNIGQYFMDHYYLRSAAFAPLGLMFKTENFLKLGGWNVDFDGSNDVTKNIEYMLNNNLYYTTEVLCKKNLGDGNCSAGKYYQRQFVLFAYLFYTDKRSLSQLKFMKFDDGFIQATVFYMALVEAELEFEDINEGNLFQEEYYNKDCLKEFREKWNIYAAQLEEKCPPIDSYTYTTVCRRLKWVN